MAVMDTDVFQIDNYNYSISSELIAQEPFYPRDACRLLIINRKTKTINEGIFNDILDPAELRGKITPSSLEYADHVITGWKLTPIKIQFENGELLDFIH